MKGRADIQRVEALVDPICAAHGVDLVLVTLLTEHGQMVLRVVIDRAGSEHGAGLGVSLADCQAVSRDLGTALDVHSELLPARYRLEVSSPGLDRPLVRLDDYRRFTGREVKLQTRAPVPDGRGGERRNFAGVLLGVDGEHVRVSVDGAGISFLHSEIAKANVVHRFE